ncbi:hypothetical protein KI440_02805 [Candidatus Saccharibacteria bacterium TM7i]|nr:hypothetical protein KI440_02805 [Candidatus Saccharibacteria bacterium TM7i]
MVVIGYVMMGVASMLFLALVVLMLILMRHVHRARDKTKNPRLFAGETENATLLSVLTVVILIIAGIAGAAVVEATGVIFLVFSVLALVGGIMGFAICLIGFIHLRRQCRDVMLRRTNNIVLPR